MGREYRPKYSWFPPCENPTESHRAVCVCGVSRAARLNQTGTLYSKKTLLPLIHRNHKAQGTEIRRGAGIMRTTSSRSACTTTPRLRYITIPSNRKARAETRPAEATSTREKSQETPPLKPHPALRSLGNPQPPLFLAILLPSTPQPPSQNYGSSTLRLPLN